MTQIDAINRMLRYIGELPVPNDIAIDDLPEGHEAVYARTILQETLREEQEERWWFNSFTTTFVPNNSGYITLPYNLISLQSTVTNKKYVANGNDLYDVINETKVFIEPVELKVLLEVSFEDVPDVFKTYVVLKAAKQLHTYLNADASTQQELLSSLQLQRIKLDRENLRQVKTNFIKGTKLVDRSSNPTILG